MGLVRLGSVGEPLVDEATSVVPELSLDNRVVLPVIEVVLTGAGGEVAKTQAGDFGFAKRFLPVSNPLLIGRFVEEQTVEIADPADLDRGSVQGVVVSLADIDRRDRGDVRQRETLCVAGVGGLGGGG
jgi:hypothetical protein